MTWLRTAAKTILTLGLITPNLLVTRIGLGDDRSACLEAAAKGQRLRDSHKLVEARPELRACAAAQCPAVVQSDCANWLADVERTMPTVVLTAKDSAGADLVDVTVTMDGQPLVSRLDGQAVPMNAGPHSFHFEAPQRPPVDRQVLVKEGEKNQSVAVTFGAAESSTSAVRPGGPSPIAPLRAVGWGLAGAGIAGLGVGVVAGLVAVAKKNGAHCDANDVCDHGTVNGIKSAALVSDAGWIAGGLLLSGGASLVVFAPSGHAGVASVGLTPVLPAAGLAIVARGAW